MSYSEVLPPSSLSRSGRMIRAALVIFPLGTILLGIASFGIWMWKKERVEDRNLRHASALRQEPNGGAWEKRRSVLTAVSAGGYEDRLASTASYLESSLGAEGMGYDPQRFVVGIKDGLPVAGVMAELTGKQRPREIVLVVMSYGNAAMVIRENESLASLLTLANWLTGEPVVRTLRFVALPLGGLGATERREVLVRFGEEMRRKDERVLHLVDASVETSGLAEEMTQAFEMAARGAMTRRMEWPRQAGIESYEGLKSLLLGLAERP